MDNKNLQKVYESAKKHYSMPDYDTFTKDMQDDGKRRSFYSSMQKEYSMPDYDTFVKDMGFSVNPPITGEETKINQNPQDTISVDQVSLPEKNAQMPRQQLIPQADLVQQSKENVPTPTADNNYMMVGSPRQTEYPKEQPSWWESAYKGLAAGIGRVGGGLLDLANIVSSNRIVSPNTFVDPYTGMQLGRTDVENTIVTPSYQEKLNDKITITKPDGTKKEVYRDPFMRDAKMVEEWANKMSMEARPYFGEKDFIDLLKSGEFGNAFQLGLATATESAPQMLLGSNLLGSVILGTTTAADQYAMLKEEMPDMPEWKRVSSAIGAGFFEQFFEQMGVNPVKWFKTKGYRQGLEEAERWAADLLMSRWKKLGYFGKNFAKSVTEEGLEEVVTSGANDTLNSLLDLIDRDSEGTGIINQYEDAKRVNPNLTIGQFALEKVRSYLNDFIGGAMAGAYMGATARGLGEGYSRIAGQEQRQQNEYVKRAINEQAQSTGQDAYEIAKGVYFGTPESKAVIDRANEMNIEDAITAEVDAISNNGNIISVSDGYGNEGVVVKGNVALTYTDYGKALIDRDNSDEQVYIRNNEGKIIPMAIKDAILQSQYDAEEYKQFQIAREKARYYSQETFNVGDNVYLTSNGEIIRDEAGNPLTSQVTSVGEDGSVNVEVEDVQGNVQEMTMQPEEALESLSPVAYSDGENIYIPKGNRIINNETGEIVQEFETKEEADAFIQGKTDVGEWNAFDIMSENKAENEGAPSSEQNVLQENQTEEQQNVIQEEQPAPSYPLTEEGEPDFSQMTADQSIQVLDELGDQETIDSFIANNLSDAQKSYTKAEKMKPKSTSFQAIKEEQQKIIADREAAKAKLDLWSSIKSANDLRKLQRTSETLSDANLAEQRQAKLEKEQAEKTAEFTGKPTFKESTKIEGNAYTRTLPDGTKVKGKYYIVPAESLIPSHDPNNNWETTEGFPTVEGVNVNDRDYKNDAQARQVTEQMAANYGGQAIENVPVVSSDGVVYDGNGRTIAGQIAAQNGTDAEYIQQLNENAANYGFTPEQIESVNNPRIVLVLDEDLPYNTDTFAKFNAQEKKTQSSTEKSVAAGKRMTESVVNQISDVLDSYSSIESLFGSEKATADLLKVLQDNGIIQPTEIAGLTENGLFSAAGREYITSLVLGSIFSEDAVRRMGNNLSLKNGILRAVPAILENRKLGEYSLIDGINEAITLLYEARANNMALPLYLRQTNAFDETPMDKFSEFSQLLASQLDAGVAKFRELLDLYNNSAKDHIGGQQAIFGEITKEDVKQSIIELYGKRGQNQETGSSETETVNPLQIVQGSEQTEQQSEAAEIKEDVSVDIPIVQYVMQQQNKLSEQVAENISQAESEVNTNPTEAQKEAGNYKKGHVKIDGYDITIEQPKGSTRSGVDENGNKWETKMNNTYGYIRGTQSVDSDHIDVFLSDNPTEGNVYVVDQINQETGEFDEHKVMYGFNSMEEAREAYLSNYSEGWKIGTITEVRKDEFKKWIDSSKRKTKPFSEYSSVNKTAGQNEVSVKPRKKLDLYKFVLKGDETRPVLSGVHYKDGMANATDGHILVRVKTEYPKEMEGKTIKKNGEEVLDKYPNVESVLPKEMGNTFPVNIDELKEQINKILDTIKKEWNDNGKKIPLYKYLDLSHVNVNIGGLKIDMKYNDFDRMVEALEMTGINSLSLDWREYGSRLVGKSDDALILAVLQGEENENAYGEVKLTDEAVVQKKISPVSESTMTDSQKLAFDAISEMLDKAGIPVETLTDEQMNQLANGSTLMTVYHGSGAKFDSFDHSFMGTGEGAQAYGWGSYVTEVEGIGRTYAESTSGNIFRSGFGDFYLREIRNGLAEGKQFDEVKEKLLAHHSEMYKKAGGNTDMYGDFISDYETLQQLNESDLPQRNLYTVEIPDNTGSNYLDWEKEVDRDMSKRLSEQLFNDISGNDTEGSYEEEVEKEMLQRDIEDSFESVRTGKDLYKAISLYIGEEAASKFLSRAGFVGISYPAQYTTGGRSDNARNYVIFNEEDLKIKDRISFMRKKKKSAPDTRLPEDESSFKGTVVSSTDGTNILNNLDNLAKDQEKSIDNRTRSFLGNVAKTLGARHYGSNSQYATFETVNGQIVTIRLADHNASTRNFDNSGRENGISIVISRKPNQGIINDGNAHLVEFFYPDKALQKADGKPLAEIVRSIKQTLYSGEYTDTTGLAQRQEVNIVQADDVRGGIVYGATVGGKIYLNGSALNPESPLHEYTHIWDNACRKNNPELWNRGVELMKQTPVWEEVKNDPNYSDLKTDDEIASEVHSRLTGKDGSRILEDMAEQVKREGTTSEISQTNALISKLKNWLSDFWYWVKDTMTPWTKEEASRVSIEDFINMPLKDLAQGRRLSDNTEDVNVQFQIKKPVEESKNLIALHNLSEESLQKAFELGGFPMPSIAVTSKDIGHTDFGDISLVFNKETINPTDRRNRLYAGDAWTPTFPEVRLKINEGVAGEIRNKIKNLLKDKEYTKDFNLYLDETNMTDVINRSGSFRDAYKGNDAMKIAFLSDKGISFKPVLVDKQYSTKVDNKTLKQIVSAIGKPANELIILGYEDKMALEPIIRKVVDSYRKNKNEEELKNVEESKRDRLRELLNKNLGKELSFSDVDSLLYSAFKYEKEGDVKVPEGLKTREIINRKFTKKLQQEYESWLDEISEGIIEKRGIRNERDTFTPSGNRRSWEALHDEITLDNVVKNMRSQDEIGGKGFFGSSIFGAAQKEISSIEDLRELARKRLAEMTDEEYEAERDKIVSRLSDIDIPGRSDYFGSSIDMQQNIIEAVKQNHTPNGIYKELKKIYPKVTKDIAEDIADIVKDIQSMSKKYFEAKPYRAVGFDEVKLAVVPKGTSKEVIDRLQVLGIPVKTYKKGDEDARKRTLNTAVKKEELLFRLPENTEDESSYSNTQQRTRRTAESLAQELGLDVEIIEDAESLEGKKRFAKGWYDVKTKKIYVVLPNATGSRDVARTILHEGVAHYNLREMLGDDFDLFLDNIYSAANKTIRDRIDRMSKEQGLSRRVATEEYLAMVAENVTPNDSNKSWFSKAKARFIQILSKLGINLQGYLTDNDFKYIVWKSYDNLKRKAQMTISEIAKNKQTEQRLLKQTSAEQFAAESSAVYRVSEENRIIEEAKANGTYMKAPNGNPTNLTERQWAQVRTKAFKDWFGDWENDPENASKVVDENGEPRVIDGLYLNIIERNPIKRLDSSINKANNYVNKISEIENETGMKWDDRSIFYQEEKAYNLLESIVSQKDYIEILINAIRKGISPSIVVAYRYGEINERERSYNYRDEIFEQGISVVGRAEELNTNTNKYYELFFGEQPYNIVVGVYAGNRGADGEILLTPATKLGLVENIGNIIKSATDNTGDFDPNNPDIRFRMADEAPKTKMDIATESLLKAGARKEAATSVRLHAMKAIGKSLRDINKAIREQAKYSDENVSTLRKIVYDLMRIGELSSLDSQDIRYIFSKANQAVTKSDLTEIANGIVDRLMDATNSRIVSIMNKKLAEAKTKKNEKVAKASKMSGYQQITLSKLRELLKDLPTDAKDKYNKIVERYETDETLRMELDAELEAYEMYFSYLETISPIMDNIKSLNEERDELLQAKKGKRGNEAKSYRETINEIDKAIVENKADLADALTTFVNEIYRIGKEGRENKNDFSRKKKARKELIRKLANFDLSDIPAYTQEQVNSELKKMRYWQNSGFANFLFSPLNSLNMYLKLFGRKHAGGKGYLFNYFEPRQRQAMTNKYVGMKQAKEELDKASIQFTGMDFNKLSESLHKKSDILITYMDGGKNIERYLTHGQALYLYMINKMSDGAMKLRKMGISEEDVENIASNMDSNVLDFADWIQNDFLPKKRAKYNKVHMDMFGVPMARIENYFPIRIAKGEVEEKQDKDKKKEDLSSTITGSIIKRTPNTKQIDLTSDALSVLYQNIDEMEDWAAYAQLREDFNTLIEYNTFKKRLNNMKSVHGAGDKLYKNFVSAIKTAVNKDTSVNARENKFFKNVSRGTTVASLNFNLNPAIKQLLGYPAIFGEADLKDIIKNTINPYGAFKWAMENLPLFEERVSGGNAGWTQLELDKESSWEVWNKKYVEWATKIGMAPNRFMDAIVCAATAKAAYDTSLRRYKKWGFKNPEEKALADAERAYNETQPSSQGLYISPMQRSNNVADIIFSLFRNANFAFYRRLVEAVRNLSRVSSKDRYNKILSSTAHRLMQEERFTEEHAKKVAREMTNRQIAKDSISLVLFGYVMNTLWSLGSNWAYLLAGDDDDEKKMMIKDALIVGLLSPITGIPLFGSFAEDWMWSILRGSYYDSTLLSTPLTDEIERTVSNSYKLAKSISKDDDRRTLFIAAEFAKSLVNLCVKTGIGINPDLLTNMVYGVINAAQSDFDSVSDFRDLILTIINAPAESREKLIIDELGITEEGMNESLSQGEITEIYDKFVDRRIERQKGILAPFAKEDYQTIKTAGKQFKKQVRERVELKQEDNGKD